MLKASKCIAKFFQSWNLLTRTSQSFEFVNVKLTVIWLFGTFFRYCVLLPGRMCILVVGVSRFLSLFSSNIEFTMTPQKTTGILKLVYLLAMTTAISLIPFAKLRNGLYEYAALTCFRVLARSFSAAITCHNKQYRPKSDGICVANHTTPIDVVILNCDRSYAMVRTISAMFFCRGE